MDVVGAIALLDSFFSGAGGHVSGVGGWGCFGGDAGVGQQSGFDGGRERVVIARTGAGEVLVGGGFVLLGRGTVGRGWRGKGKEGSMAGGGLGRGGGGQFFADGCAGGQGGAPDWVGTVWSVDDGRGGDAVGTGVAGVGVGRVGEWAGPGLVGVGGGIDRGAGGGPAGGDCDLG